MKTRKKEKPERVCPECQRSFYPLLSGKRVFCCDSCKDKYNAKRRNNRDHLINFQLKKYLHNYNTLRLFESNEKILVTYNELTKLKFDFNFLPAADSDKGNLYFPFGYIRMYCTDHHSIFNLSFTKDE